MGWSSYSGLPWEIWHGPKALMPIAKCIFQRAIENVKPNVEEMLHGEPIPSHLLLLYEPFTDDLIDCRFHEARADSLTVTVTLAVIWNKAAIALDVRAEFLNRFEQLVLGLPMVLECCALQIHLHKLQVSESLKHIAVPQIPLDALERGRCARPTPQTFG